MLENIKKLIKDEEAPTAVEYALMVALIAAVIIAGAKLLGTNSNNQLDAVAKKVAKPE
jgi:pilus assembly protein Flp/PilA